MITKNQIIEVSLDELLENEFSANEEDTTTFDKLKEQLEKWGVLDLPVVRELQEAEKKPGKNYKIVHGRHRIAALKAAGETRTHVVLMATKFESPEDEFNLVNNINLVHGEISPRNLTKIIRRDNLDVTKIEIFKHPINSLIPRISDQAKQNNTEAQRNAAINKMTLEIAKEIAKSLVDEKDELLTFLVVQDKPAAILRIPFSSGKVARQRSLDIKERIMKSLEGLPEIDDNNPKNA